MNLRMKKTIAITIIAVVLVTGSLWAAGFWTSNSPRYWRRPAQSVLFFTARLAPNSLVASVTRMALRTHIEGTSYEELEAAAALFEKVGEYKAASKLWLSLVRLDVASNKLDEAVRHATLSQKAVSSEEALTSLVILNIKVPESRSRWISELQTNYRENELSQVSLCLADLNAFEKAIPVSCQNIRWVFEKATSGKNEFEKLSKQIENLPNEAAQHIKKYEREIAGRNVEQEQNRLDLLDIDRQKSEATANAFLQVIIDLLPLPKADDTLDTFLAREGICLLPYIRWACRAASLESAFEVKKRHKQLDEYRETILELIRLNDKLNSYDQQKIEYWRSVKPLEELKKAKGNILPTFRNNIEETVSSRKENAGLSVAETIAIVAQ